MKFCRSEEEVRYARAQGRVIHARRAHLAMTRKELAWLSGLTYQSVFRIEMGDRTASAWDLERLARVLRVDVSELWPGHEPEPVVDAMLALASMPTAGALA